MLSGTSVSRRSWTSSSPRMKLGCARTSSEGWAGRKRRFGASAGTSSAGASLRRWTRSTARPTIASSAANAVPSFPPRAVAGPSGGSVAGVQAAVSALTARSGRRRSRACRRRPDTATMRRHAQDPSERRSSDASETLVTSAPISAGARNGPSLDTDVLHGEPQIALEQQFVRAAPARARPGRRPRAPRTPGRCRSQAIIPSSRNPGVSLIGAAARSFARSGIGRRVRASRASARSSAAAARARRHPRPAAPRSAARTASRSGPVRPAARARDGPASVT